MKSLVQDPERKIEAELILKRLKLEDAAGLHYVNWRMNQIHLNMIRLKLVVDPGPRPRRLKLVVDPGPRPRCLKLEDGHQKRPSPNLCPFIRQCHGSEREFLMRRLFPRKAF